MGMHPVPFFTMALYIHSLEKIGLLMKFNIYHSITHAISGDLTETRQMDFCVNVYSCACMWHTCMCVGLY